MRGLSPMRSASTALLVICALAVNIGGQRSIKDTILAEREDWVDPNDFWKTDGKESSEETVDRGELSQVEALPAGQDGALERSTAPQGTAATEDRSPVTCERSLGLCEKKLLQLQMTADLTDKGALTADMVYLRRWLQVLITKLDRMDQQDSPARLEMTFTARDLADLRSSLNEMDFKAANRISSRLNELISAGKLSYDSHENSSALQLLWLSLCDLIKELNLLTIIRLAIFFLAAIFIVVLVKSRSRVVTFGYCSFFLFWLSYFWYWQNLLRRSEAERHLLYRKNPCEDTRSWYNPARLFEPDSKDCQEFIRQQYTPPHMEYSPIEVLLHMVSEYSSKAISVGLVNLLSGLGRAVREFADQQSWFSVVPAFFLVFAVTLALAFKASGMALSVFGCRLEASSGQSSRSCRRAAALRRRSRERVDGNSSDDSEDFVIRKRVERVYFVDSRGMLPPRTCIVPRNRALQTNQRFSKSEGDNASASDYDTALDEDVS